MNRRALAAAYARADYQVQWRPGQTLHLRPGQPAAAVRSACGRQTHWAVLTPCNPRSRRLPRLTNQRRLQALARQLRALAPCHRPALNRDAAGRWPDEPGYWLAAPRALLLRLARRFRQNALLLGRRGGPGRVHWLQKAGVTRHPP